MGLCPYSISPLYITILVFLLLFLLYLKITINQNIFVEIFVEIKNILPVDFFLTLELVYANITIVMETDRKKITEENLIRCGREEFLEKGSPGRTSGISANGPELLPGLLFLF